MLKKISGWGKYPKIYSNMVAPKSFNSLMEILLSKPNSFIAIEMAAPMEMQLLIKS